MQEENPEAFVRETFAKMIDTRKKRDEAIAEFNALKLGLADYQLRHQVQESLEIDQLIDPKLGEYLMCW